MRVIMERALGSYDNLGDYFKEELEGAKPHYLLLVEDHYQEARLFPGGKPPEGAREVEGLFLRRSQYELHIPATDRVNSELEFEFENRGELVRFLTERGFRLHSDPARIIVLTGYADKVDWKKSDHDDEHYIKRPLTDEELEAVQPLPPSGLENQMEMFA